MGKQIKRFGLPVLLVAIAAFTTVPDAGSQEVSPPQSTPELACALREAVGFGPGDALPALAGDGLHRAMIESAAAFADAHHGTLAPLINNYHEARRQLTHALSWGENVQEAHEQLTASAAAIIQACQGLLPGLAGDVPADFQPLVGLVQARAGGRNAFGWVIAHTRGEPAVDDLHANEVCRQGKSQSCSPLFPIRVRDKVGYIDADGRIAIAPTYDAGWLFSNGLARIMMNEKYGFIDETGRLVIAPELKLAGDFSEELAAVGSKGDRGYIDTNGNVVIQRRYHWSGPFRDGRAPVQVAGNWGFLDKKGNWVIPAIYEDANTFSEGLSCVRKNNRWTFIDTSGKPVLDQEFDAAHSFSNGCARVRVGNRLKYVTRVGDTVCEPAVQNTGDFSEGFALFEQNGKYGYIDKTCAVAIPARFTKALAFQQGLAAVQIENRYGFIDRTGKMVIEPQYAYAASFVCGLADVGIGGFPYGYSHGYINRMGEYVWKPTR